MKMKKKVISKKIVSDYKVVLVMAGNDYTGKGKTLLDALNDIKIDWIQIKAKGVIRVSKGKQSIERLFQMKQLRRIFVNKIMRLVGAKRLELFLNEQNGKRL